MSKKKRRNTTLEEQLKASQNKVNYNDGYDAHIMNNKPLIIEPAEILQLRQKQMGLNE